MQLLSLVAILFAAVSVVFALQNNVPVIMTFFPWRFDSSLAVVLLIAMALGGFIVALLSTPSTLRRQWAISRQRKRIDELEQTCSDQKGTIAELEGRAAGTEPAAVPEPLSYVGLKQLIAGSTDRDKQGSGSSS
jgi:uncharacterized integral membrane protein